MRILLTAVVIAALCPCAVRADAVDHARILRSLDDDAFKRGKGIYESFCFACHGLDGKTPTNPLARSFAEGEFKNGADPYSLWKTVTFGFNTMPATQASLTPTQRYDVIHYIREAFLKKDNPKQYTKIDEAYLKSLGVTEEAARELNDRDRDYGPVLGAQLQGPMKSDAALHFRLPHQVSYSFDTHTFRSAGLWTGGFLDLSETQHYKQRGERLPKPSGEFVGGLQTFAWKLGDSFDIPDDAKRPRGPVGDDLAKYFGYYLHGDRAVVSYAIGGRNVLETVGVDKSPSLLAVHHTMHIAAGDTPLQLAVAQIAKSTGGGIIASGSDKPTDRNGPAAGAIAVVTGEAKKISSKAPTGQPRHVIAGDEATKLDLGTPDRTIVVRFQTNKSGTLVASAPAKGEWKPNGKSLYINGGGRLVFDIGWVGAMQSKSRVNDSKPHTATLVVTEEDTRLYVDGKLEATKKEFRRPVEQGHVFKIGATATNFGGDYTGDITSVTVYDFAMPADGVAGKAKFDAKPLLVWTPKEAAAAQPVANEPEGPDFAAAAVVGDTDGLTWTIDEANRVVLSIPPSKESRVIRVIRSAGAGDAQLARVGEYVKFSASNAKVVDPRDLTRGGPERWTEDMAVEGALGEPINGYALDTITVPFDNPYNAWMRTSAVDFFDDGRAAVSTHGGDVWIVSGIDDKLGKVTWSRYAAGLFEPFGLKIVDGVIYVTTRDGIKRLHDYDGNGEADFVEAFHIDEDVSSTFHAYNFDLQVDKAGNFYFAKAGQYTFYDRPGTIMKVPPTGGPAEIISWGIRTPNGMGILPDGRLTFSDNQGPWMPAGKVSLIVPGEDRFFGNMPNKSQTEWTLQRNGGKLPETYTEPFIWTPQELDNSCGGQLWAADKRWGPLAGRLIHSSFGKGWLYYLSLQQIDGQMQSSIVALPHQWDAGVMRLRTNPADGQVYGVGLSGWQGPKGGQDGCFQRLRYTGEPVRIIEKTRITETGIELTLSFPVTTKSARNESSYRAEMWDYLWSKRYGSAQFSVRHEGQQGHDAVRIADADLSDDGRVITLTTPDLAVCDQLQLDVELEGADGKAYKERVYFTIHHIPGKK